MAAGKGDAGAGGDRPRYLTPSEVQEVMRRMWARNPGILNLLFAIDSGELVRAVIAGSNPCFHITLLTVSRTGAVGVNVDAVMSVHPVQKI